jgi:chromosome segregation ATPase
MCRKIAIAVGAVLLGLVIVTYTSLPSLVHVKCNDVMSWMDRQVPIETKIKQLRLETDKIDNEIKANLGKLAKLEVETEKLEQNVVTLRNEQADRKKDISAMATKLETKTEQVSKKDLRGLTDQLDLAVNNFQVKDAKLKSMEKLLEVKRQTLEAAHQKISAMKDQRDELRVTIAKLETRKELVDIKTQQSTIEISDSRISHCRQLANDINTQLSEKEKLADLNVQYGFSGKAVIAEKDAKNAQEVLKSAKKVLSDDQDDK